MWQVAHRAVLVKTVLPRSAAVASKLPSGGGGVSRVNWYSRSGGSLGFTRSGFWTILIPSRRSENDPCPPIWVTATYWFQYEIGPSPVYVSFFTPSSPYAGGMTSGVFLPSMLNRGSYLPGPQDRYTSLAAAGTFGEAAMILPGSRVVLAHPSRRLPMPDGLSTVEWQIAQVMPTLVSRSRPSICSTVPTKPTTAFSLIRATVTAGSVRSTVPCCSAVMTSGGSASTSTFSPSCSAVSGSIVDSMTSWRPRRSVHSCSSPKVSKRKISCPSSCFFPWPTADDPSPHGRIASAAASPKTGTTNKPHQRLGRVASAEPPDRRNMMAPPG